MKKLIAMIPTEGKTKEEIIEEATAQLQAKGFLPPEETTEPNEYDAREDNIIRAMDSVNSSE
jgi:mannitol/fructose-specific phosphotransferase system IIA component (Ntr-type)